MCVRAWEGGGGLYVFLVQGFASEKSGSYPIYAHVWHRPLYDLNAPLAAVHHALAA